MAQAQANAEQDYTKKKKNMSDGTNSMKRRARILSQKEKNKSVCTGFLHMSSEVPEEPPWRSLRKRTKLLDFYEAWDEAEKMEDDALRQCFAESHAAWVEKTTQTLLDTAEPLAAATSAPSSHVAEPIAAATSAPSSHVAEPLAAATSAPSSHVAHEGAQAHSQDEALSQSTAHGDGSCWQSTAADHGDGSWWQSTEEDGGSWWPSTEEDDGSWWEIEEDDGSWSQTEHGDGSW